MICDWVASLFLHSPDFDLCLHWFCNSILFLCMSFSVPFDTDLHWQNCCTKQAIVCGVTNVKDRLLIIILHSTYYVCCQIENARLVLIWFFGVKSTILVACYRTICCNFHKTFLNAIISLSSVVQIVCSGFMINKSQQLYN